MQGKEENLSTMGRTPSGYINDTWSGSTGPGTSERRPSRSLGGLVLIPKGRIGSVTAARFAEALFAARTESSAVIVNLASVDYISGAGVSVLGNAAHNGNRIVVCRA